MRVVCGALLRQRASSSIHFGLSTVAGLPDTKDYRGGRSSERSDSGSERRPNAAFDYCRSAINHQTAVNGVIALDRFRCH